MRFGHTAGNAVYADSLTQAFATSGGALLLCAGGGIAVTGAALSDVGAAVPEPDTRGILPSGIAVTGVALSDAAAAAPEPDARGMRQSGIAVTGIALRHRRSASTPPAR